MGFDLISRLLFPSPPPTYNADSFPKELIWVPKTLDPDTAKPDECIPCLLLPYSSARFLMFYLHSNAEDIGRCYAFCASLRMQFQVHVMAVEYPGYGICPGGPCDEQKVTETANTAFRFVVEVLKWPLDSILIFGRSIGCGPAISLALRYQVSGVIVVSPMLSVKELCRDAIGPLARLIQERFPNRERAAQLRCPLLVIHGQKDEMIPQRHGVELYAACRSKKLLVCPQDMEHNTSLFSNVAYFVLPVLQFFALPDYCFEEMQIPDWVFDKRLCAVFGKAVEMPSTIQSKSAQLLDDGTFVESPAPASHMFGCFTCPTPAGMLPSGYDPWSVCKPQAPDDGRRSPRKERAEREVSRHTAESSEQQVDVIPELGIVPCAEVHDGVFKGHGLRSRTDCSRLEPKRLSASLLEMKAVPATRQDVLLSSEQGQVQQVLSPRPPQPRDAPA
mmetsp:Transcript_17947/g.32580  ORF Transcript_17947/g.32580 Transcript_17947/m.32580 type:complete len:446 (+) Transcript_17947:132-1469(+)